MADPTPPVTPTPTPAMPPVPKWLLVTLVGLGGAAVQLRHLNQPWANTVATIVAGAAFLAAALLHAYPATPGASS